MKYETAIIVTMLLVCLTILGSIAWNFTMGEIERLEERVEYVEKECCGLGK